MAFPNLKRPRVIWAGIGGDTGVLKSIHQAVDSELRKLGIAGEAGSFTPHLTLGRVKEAGPDLAELVRGMPPVNIGPAAINEVVLMESRLSRLGPAYSRLAGFALGK